MAETITEEVPHTKEKLEELIAAAKLQYSLKKYAAAADLYADAAELQDALNGEHAPQNAELLYYYGIALHKVAIAKSDVLGAQVTSEEKKKQSKTEKVQKGASGTSNGTASGSAVKKEETVESTPYFQLTGDENWTDSEGEDDEGEGGDGEEDEDDLQNAYETFEMARVLYAKQLDALDEAGDAAKGKGKAQLTPEAHAIKQKLADCHAFLAELSLESDRPHDAVADARKALELQEELHPLEHENVSEAHYWLSMALELASVAPEEQESGESANDAEQKAQQAPAVNMELRNEAAKHTASVIQSLESRLKIEREALSGDKLTAEEKKEKEIIIKDKAELLEDMELRVRIHQLITATLLTYHSSPTCKQTPSLKPSTRSIPPSCRAY
jgi:HAT1-interacting factor 1